MELNNIYWLLNIIINNNSLQLIINQTKDDLGITDNNLIEEAHFKLENEFNFKQPVVELVITAERLENTAWYCTNNFLLKEYNDTVIRDLNKDSSSQV